MKFFSDWINWYLFLAISALKESILQKLGEGKHIIHIIYKDRELTLSLTEEEFNNGIIRGEQLNIVPREEDIQGE